MSWREDKAVAIVVARLKGWKVHVTRDPRQPCIFHLENCFQDGRSVGLGWDILRTITTWAEFRRYVCDQLPHAMTYEYFHLA